MVTIGMVLCIAGGMLFVSQMVTFRLGFGGKKAPEYDGEEDADINNIIKMLKIIMRAAALLMAGAGAILILIGRILI